MITTETELKHKLNLRDRRGCTYSYIGQRRCRATGRNAIGRCRCKQLRLRKGLRNDTASEPEPPRTKPPHSGSIGRSLGYKVCRQSLASQHQRFEPPPTFNFLPHPEPYANKADTIDATMSVLQRGPDNELQPVCHHCILIRLTLRYMRAARCSSAAVVHSVRTLSLCALRLLKVRR